MQPKKAVPRLQMANPIEAVNAREALNVTKAPKTGNLIEAESTTEVSFSDFIHKIWGNSSTLFLPRPDSF